MVSSRKKRLLIAIGLAIAIFFAAVYIAGRTLMAKLDPMVREQVVQYLHEHFHADVQLAALHIDLPHLSKASLVFRRQRGAIVQVAGEKLIIRRGGIQLLAIDQMHFTVDVASVLEPRKSVQGVSLQGVEITVPPKGESPRVEEPQDEKGQNKKLNVVIEQVDIRDCKLVILPKDKTKKPLDYRIEHLLLTPIAPDSPWNYAADLNIPKPPGHILSRGKFGPWNADEPGDTFLDGHYQYENADLGIFNGIAGILSSTGDFKGTLDTIEVKGDASVPDFRLKISGNRVPLRVQFEALVDGTNGNTTLKPVQATLGQTRFTTTGTIFKHEDAPARSISLQVKMPDGYLPDLLRLAMKGSPFMDGRITLASRIDIPPLSGKVKQKLLLDGTFNLRQSRFLKSTIQSQLDSLSRHAQGQPNNEEIDSVASNMKGSFRLENQLMTFRSLTFDVPGAGVALKGGYNIGADTLDFTGTLKLDAKLSQMVTGWKSLVLKPIDPIFSKNGAGTFLNIVVEGTARRPELGVEFAHHKFMTPMRKKK